MGRGNPRINNTSGSTAINKKKSEAFLVKNFARDEVEDTSSGLQYEVLKKGDGGCRVKIFGHCRAEGVPY